ncbi:amidohydrolase family protein [Caballeronia sp. LZ033]|uniref:amidohydrolase family protein n=1 Tax=Caballeronia sp. LZ033 TaxID=3038566 RepID=UPI00285EACD7|nr:amidohydrolase family protein [Caballeronia sp. LZ033]MDR5815580.1 amidohydrolase family protein [Caballeronia sp. LZ033]
MTTLYDGPIIDAHQHFWDLEANHYPWLAGDTLVPHRYGDYSAIKRTYLPADYLRDAAGHDVVGSVYVEAEWDPADPLGETRYVSQLAASSGRPNAIAAQAWLDRDDTETLLAAQSAFERVRSMRHKPGAPDDAGRTLMSDARWRRGYAQLAQHGLHFELQAPWTQMHEAARLARDFPETLLIVNHSGVPGDRAPDTLRGWGDAMAALAALPNVSVKVSGLCERGQPWSVAANQPVIDTLHALFGAERLMFGSNFPVDGMFISLDGLLDGFMQLVRAWPQTQQRAFFHDTAERVYRPLGLAS